jgi:hypothetical protein
MHPVPVLEPMILLSIAGTPRLGHVRNLVRSQEPLQPTTQICRAARGIWAGHRSWLGDHGVRSVAAAFVAGKADPVVDSSRLVHLCVGRVVRRRPQRSYRAVTSPGDAASRPPTQSPRRRHPGAPGDAADGQPADSGHASPMNSRMGGATGQQRPLPGAVSRGQRNTSLTRVEEVAVCCSLPPHVVRLGSEGAHLHDLILPSSHRAWSQPGR